MFNFTESAKKALDVFASATGLRLFPDPLKHPGGEDVCTLDLPGYRQLESYTCGFVAGAMVLHTFRPGASLKKFFEQCSPDYEHGLDTKPLIRCLRTNGIGVSQRHNLDFEKIVSTLDQGYPHHHPHPNTACRRGPLGSDLRIRKETQSGVHRW
jgi:hypothetical protein